MTRAECPHCVGYPVPELERLAVPEEPWDEHDNEECAEHPCPKSEDGQHHVRQILGEQVHYDPAGPIEIKFRCGECGKEGTAAIESEWIWWND